MEKLIKIIIERLNKKGMHVTLVPSFIRDVTNVAVFKFSDPKELNRRLGTLGWHEYELDDHTFQLIEAVMEKECFITGIDMEEGAGSQGCSIPRMFQEVIYSQAS